MKAKFTDIDWVTNGANPEDLGLPSECVLEVEDVIDNLADLLSDEFGWLVSSFNYQFIETE